MRSTTPSHEHVDGLTIVRLVGDAYARGYQHGSLIRDQVRLLRDALHRDLLFSRNAAVGVTLVGLLTVLTKQMERFIPRPLQDEMHGIADGADVSYRDILLFNCFDDLLHGLTLLAPLAEPLRRVQGLFACSSFVALTEQGPLHARNLDYMVNDSLIDPNGVVTRILRENVIVFIHEPDTGIPFTSVAWPGYVGIVTGMNAEGLSLACHTSATAGETMKGVPLPLLYRHVVQHSGTLAQAEYWLRRAPRTIGNNLTVSSARDNDARAFEITPTHVAAWAPTNGLLSVTNHFQDVALVEPQQRMGWVFPNSLYRLERLQSVLPAWQATAANAQQLLMDTTMPQPDLTEWDCLRNPGTIYSTVFEPTRHAMSVRAHDQDERQFQEIDLGFDRKLPLAS